MSYLRPDQIEFAKNLGGLLDVALDGMTIENVQCVELFPLSDPGRFVSVVKSGKPLPEEVGIIEDLATLTDQQRRLVEEAIAFRYFVPQIEEVHGIEHIAGLYEIKVTTARGRRSILMLNPRENVSTSESGVVVITDVEGCRFRINCLESLDAKSQAELERVLL